MAKENSLKSKEKVSPDTHILRFYINGKPFVVENPDPRTLLVDFLRSPDAGLYGTKKSCAQGGCGACTVMLSWFDPQTKKVNHESINSCMRPICSLEGMNITTVEGIGSVNTAVDVVQEKIAKCNGTQCGFCTPGWVMNMKSYLTANKGKKLTKTEIQGIFDGNICRCTGYRPILYAMMHFADDFTKKDKEGVMECVVDPMEQPKVVDTQVEFPKNLKQPPKRTAFEKGEYQWHRPTSLKELMDLLKKGYGPDELKLVRGNTSYGIYNPYPTDEADYYNPHHFVDISWVKELQDWKVTSKGIYAGAATTYTQFLDRVNKLVKGAKGGKAQALDMLQYMAQRTAGTIVRNAASLGGNTMLVVHHILKGSPFPSDLFTALVALGTEVEVMSTKWKNKKRIPILDFAHNYAKDAALRDHSVLLGYHIPFLPDNTVARTYKVALRSENSHTIVNAGMVFETGKNKEIKKATVVYAGISPVAFHAKGTEDYLRGKSLNTTTLQEALKILRAEVLAIVKKNEKRMAGLPNEGFTTEYRLHLAESFLYKHFIYTLQGISPSSVPSILESAGTRYIRPNSRGTQSYEKYPDEYPVNKPIIKLEAFMQATGEAVYHQDMELNARGLDAAWVTSNKAYAKISYQIPGGKKPKPCTVDELKKHLAVKYPGFFDYVTVVDIPNQDTGIYQGGAGDDPIFVEKEVTSYGQSIGLILSNSDVLSQEIAYYVSTRCIHYDTKGKNPLLGIRNAIKANSIFQDCPTSLGKKPSKRDMTHIWKIIRAGSDLSWATENPVPLEPGDHVVSQSISVGGVDCMLVTGTQEIGGQLHFYMGPQSVIAVPQEHNTMLVMPDSQSPDSIQSSVMNTLSTLKQPWRANQVEVRIKRVAGAYGGKTTRSPFIASPVAVAAHKHNRPVRLVMRRENDTAMVGHRHPTLSVYQIAVGTGKDNPANKGKIMGLKIDWWFDGGNTYDCSYTVLDCMQLRSSTGYFIPNYGSSGDVAKTNISSNTAYRAFGMLQGTLGLEDALEASAWQLGIRPEVIRGQNLYSQGQSTPFGQEIEYLYLREVWEYTKKRTDFDKRLKAVEKFNRENKWVKRGISMIPIMYGSGYNATFLEQGGALVEIYSQDGTVVVRHGGVDMGQGVNTIVAQVTAEALNIPLRFVQIGATDTHVVPNPISTGASTGSAFNAGAAKEAGGIIKRRLETYVQGLRKQHGDAWCTTQGIDYWNYKEGWRAISTTTKKMIWPTIVGMAYFDRINLSEQVRFRQKGGNPVDTGLVFKPGTCTPETLQYFVGFTFSAACSEVEVDILTGETTVLRSDIVYDVGKSMNPALDVGQVEGAFIQGLGYVLTEELVYETDGPDKGRLNSLNTWTYKPPAHTTIPVELHVDLFPRSDAKVKPDPNLLFGSKEVGEPPLVLASTVYFAVKHAVHSARIDQGHAAWFRMDAPLTPQRVRETCRINASELTL